MPSRSSLILPVVLITVGVGWLLSALELLPSIDWLWTLGLMVAGGLTFAMAGFDKVTAVVAPMLMAGGLLSTLRQTGHLSFEIEMPILVNLLGVLLLIARRPSVPEAQWLLPPSDPPA